MEALVKETILIFNHPFFAVVGGIATIGSITGILITGYLVAKGVFPVLYRLGIGLSSRKIAVFAEDEFDSIKNLLIDSGMFAEKNIVKIDKQSIKKAEALTLFLVHWKPFESDIEKILQVKKDSDALIIYAPQDEGFIDKKNLSRINAERHCTIVNFRGRLLNDILNSIMTTSYERGK